MLFYSEVWCDTLISLGISESWNDLREVNSYCTDRSHGV